MITLNDAEQRFADSPEGAAKIALERSKFELRNAYLGDRAPAWTDSIEASVARRLHTEQARGRVQGAALIADAERRAAELHDGAEAARSQHIAGLNSWRR